MAGLDIVILDKLARYGSLGFGAVALPLVFLGYLLVRSLPKDKDVGDNKYKLYGVYLKLSGFVAFFYFVSGISNAYFNYDKAKEAQEETAQVVDNYEDQLKEVESEKDALIMNFESLKETLKREKMLTPAVTSVLDNTGNNIQRIRLKPKQELFTNPGVR